MKYIQLTQSKQAMVDDEDYEYLSQWKWMLTNNGYAARGEYSGSWKEKGYRKQIGMHSQVMNTPKGMSTDHINGNKLDNRKENLRVCNASQNMANVAPYQTNTTGYKGVSFKKGKFEASIETRKDGKRRVYYLGRFIDIKAAAKAYNAKAEELFGEYARKNNC